MKQIDTTRIKALERDLDNTKKVLVELIQFLYKELGKDTVEFLCVQLDAAYDRPASEPAPEKAPEVSDKREWLTEDECHCAAMSSAYTLHGNLNALLTRKLREGKLPVVAKEDVARSVSNIDYYRSKPRLNMDRDMVRITLDMRLNDWRRLSITPNLIGGVE